MINDSKEVLVEHHIHYKEIHGYDETIWITQSEHIKLHRNLRMNGKCNVPSDELNKISKAAYLRTEKAKEAAKQHSQTDKHKNIRRKCGLKNIQYINFIDTPGPNTRFNEQITYNHATGAVYYSTWFSGRHNHKLPVINI